MLNKISWSYFLFLIASIVSVYYLYILLFYYRKEIIALGSRKKSVLGNNSSYTSAISNSNQNRSEPEPNNETDAQQSFTAVHELLEDLKVIFQRASKTKMIKEELIQAIGSKLKTYPLPIESELVEDINTHLIMEAKEKCQLDFSPEDLKGIWNV
jgi:hypothetical protein